MIVAGRKQTTGIATCVNPDAFTGLFIECVSGLGSTLPHVVQMGVLVSVSTWRREDATTRCYPSNRIVDLPTQSTLVVRKLLIQNRPLLTVLFAGRVF